MAFRTVIINNPSTLHARKEQLEIHQEETFRVPLDDILMLLIESPDVVFSSACLSKLAGRDIAVVTCNEKYMPAAYVSAYLPLWGINAPTPTL